MESNYWVEYIENGFHCSDSWAIKTIADEIRAKEVEIIGIYMIYDDGDVSPYNVMDVFFDVWGN